jgi:hypothetical protein
MGSHNLFRANAGVDLTTFMCEYGVDILSKVTPVPRYYIDMPGCSILESTATLYERVAQLRPDTTT